MKIYFVQRGEGDRVDYDQYDSMVMIAKSEADARKMHPSGEDRSVPEVDVFGTWTNRDPSLLVITEIGTANRDEKQPRVVCASFNAG